MQVRAIRSDVHVSSLTHSRTHSLTRSLATHTRPRRRRYRRHRRRRPRCARLHTRVSHMHTHTYTHTLSLSLSPFLPRRTLTRTVVAVVQFNFVVRFVAIGAQLRALMHIHRSSSSTPRLGGWQFVMRVCECIKGDGTCNIPHQPRRLPRSLALAHAHTHARTHTHMNTSTLTPPRTHTRTCTHSPTPMQHMCTHLSET